VELPQLELKSQQAELKDQLMLVNSCQLLESKLGPEGSIFSLVKEFQLL